MRPIRYATKELVRAFDARKVLDLAQVKAALGTPVKMTALRQLDYHSSYSHADRYYTLERIVCHHLMDPAQTQRIHELFRLG